MWLLLTRLPRLELELVCIACIVLYCYNCIVLYCLYCLGARTGTTRLQARLAVDVKPGGQHSEGGRLLLVGNAPRTLSKRDGSDVEFLNLVDSPDGDGSVGGESETVFVDLRVEGTHVLHLLQVDVTEHQLLVAAVYDCGAVTASEHVADCASPELPEDCGLSAQSHLLLLCQSPGCADHEVEETAVTESAQEVVGTLELGYQDAPGDDLPAQVLLGDLL